LPGADKGSKIFLEGKTRKEAAVMCYSYREYRMEQEARRQREEEERKRREEQAKKTEKEKAEKERELVRA
jgi:hypothetical protein